MAKCNLLKPVDCSTGTFFMFSQYAQDLTKEYTQADAYRCIPSKFAALNLNIKPDQNDPAYSDKQLGQIFQNYFENACTCMRAAGYVDPKLTSGLLWAALEKYNLISIESIGDDNFYHPECKYIGDINIYSYNYNPTEDGVGYSEIYCYIPNSARSFKYPSHQIPLSEVHTYTIDDEVTSISGYPTDDPSTTFTGLHLLLEDPSGTTPKLKYYNEETITTNGTDSIRRFYSNNSYMPDVLLGEGSIEGIVENGDDEDSFNFNTIIVFYNIVSKREDKDIVISENIPLGIFFTGTPKEGQLTNSVTKFNNNKDIYNQGTSYGLRICSRFLCTPNMTVFEDATASALDSKEDMTQVLSAIAENNLLFEYLAQDINDMSSKLSTHMANFRNNKVNVPYTRTVGGKQYWFVNGKNTGVVADANQQEVSDLSVRVNNLEENLDQEVQKTINELIESGQLNIKAISSADITVTINAFRSILGLSPINIPE